MLKSTLKAGAAALLAAAIAALPLQLLAQTTNKPAATKKAAETKKRTGGGVHGYLAALDKSAKTVTVGKYTYHVTAETKIAKAGKPATLDDGVVGEYVSLGYRTAEDGKRTATKVTFGRPEGKSADKKPKAN